MKTRLRACARDGCPEVRLSGREALANVAMEARRSRTARGGLTLNREMTDYLGDCNGWNEQWWSF